LPPQDLLKILVDCDDNLTLRNDVIWLLVNLTQPAYLCFGSSYPQGKERQLMRCFMEVNHHLRLYKEAFSEEHQAMNVLGSVLGEVCQKVWEGGRKGSVRERERVRERGV
jgi:timeless